MIANWEVMLTSSFLLTRLEKAGIVFIVRCVLCAEALSQWDSDADTPFEAASFVGIGLRADWSIVLHFLFKERDSHDFIQTCDFLFRHAQSFIQKTITAVF